jgi:hypothetical protein
MGNRQWLSNWANAVGAVLIDLLINSSSREKITIRTQFLDRRLSLTLSHSWKLVLPIYYAQ